MQFSILGIKFSVEPDLGPQALPEADRDNSRLKKPIANTSLLASIVQGQSSQRPNKAPGSTK